MTATPPIAVLGSSVSSSTASAGGLAAQWGSDLGAQALDWGKSAYDALGSLVSGVASVNPEQPGTDTPNKQADSGGTPVLHSAEETQFLRNRFNPVKQGLLAADNPTLTLQKVADRPPDEVKQLLESLKGSKRLDLALSILSSVGRVTFFNPNEQTFLPMAGASVGAAQLGAGDLQKLVESMGRVALAHESDHRDPAVFAFDLRSIYDPDNALNSQQAEDRVFDAENLWGKKSQAPQIMSFLEQRTEVFDAILKGLMHPEWKLRKPYFVLNRGKRTLNELPSIFYGSGGTVSDLRQYLFGDRFKASHRALFVLREVLYLNNQEISDLTGVSDNRVHDKVKETNSWLRLYMRTPSQQVPLVGTSEQGGGMTSSSALSPQNEAVSVASETKLGMEQEEKSALALLVGPGKYFASEAEAEAAFADGYNWLKKTLIPPVESKAVTDGQDRTREKRSQSVSDFQLLENAKSLTLYSALPTKDNLPRTYDLSTTTPESPTVTKFQRLMQFIRAEKGNNWKREGPSLLYPRIRGLGPFMKLTAQDGSEHWLRVPDLFSALFQQKWGSREQAHDDSTLLQQAQRNGAQETYEMRIKSLEKAIAMG